MDNSARLVAYMESSFLGPFLTDSSITDISYNGESFYCQHNKKGRMTLDIAASKDEVGFFLRQIANLSEKQFSFSNPLLDVSFGRYRLNASYSSITRVKDAKSFSFSLRLEKEGSVLFMEPSFFGGNSKSILLNAIKNKESIVISGETGSGKTELQKYLLLNLPSSTRVIVIDNVNELELSRKDDIDLTSWLVDENVPDSSFSSLIRNALRNNPDYLLVAESRGGEMLDAINSAMSGHPIITTIHAFSLESIPHRMARLAMMAGKNINYDDVMEDIYMNFSIFVFVKKDITEGNVKRYIDSIGKIDGKKMKVIYRRNEDE